MTRALCVAVLLLAAAPAAGHGLDYAEMLQGEIAAHRRATAEAATEGDRAEALFRLGDAVETLVDALNRDVAFHGRRELLAEQLVERLRGYALDVAWAPGENRYVYDQAAFADYLRRLPRGPWAAEAKFRLIARRFHATTRPADPAALVGTDAAGVLRAVADAERFLREHAGHARADTVRFFLAVDHYRIARHVTDPGQRHAHAQRARQALRQTVELSTDAFEVRAAQTLLQTLGR